jgi:sulfate adenylyltransferase large subunit
MPEDSLKLVIVGHVDHGKSTLIGRLFFDTDSLPEGKMDEIKKTCESLGRELEFAYIMDYFQEEREQNVTIDTAQAFFKTSKRHYVIIDAPGHKEFIKNMVTGASQAEAAVLIVDAREGVREQTKRHAYVLSLLGLEQVIVAINKMDLVRYDEKRFNEIRKELKKFLGGISIEPKYSIPISARHGDNVAKRFGKMKWYDGPTILEALDSFRLKPRPFAKPLRFPVQDVYKIDGKRIIVGRIESGRLEVGDAITFLPEKNRSKVMSIEVFGRQKVAAEAGESIGITIEDPHFVDRGQVVCSGKEPKVSQRFKANVFWMDRQPLRAGERITFKCATQEVRCVIERIEKRIDSSTLETMERNAKELNGTEVGELVIRTDKPVAIEDFNDVEELGRFVLERGGNTVAGGIITHTEYA